MRIRVRLTSVDTDCSRMLFDRTAHAVGNARWTQSKRRDLWDYGWCLILFCGSFRIQMSPCKASVSCAVALTNMVDISACVPYGLWRADVHVYYLICSSCPSLNSWRDRRCVARSISAVGLFCVRPLNWTDYTLSYSLILLFIISHNLTVCCIWMDPSFPSACFANSVKMPVKKKWKWDYKKGFWD